MFRAIWRVSFALVLALSVGLVMPPPGEVGADTQEFATNGTFSWTVPAGVSQIMVKAWGGGGAGGGSNNYTLCQGAGGGGGGGGAYASSNLSVTPGQILQVVVGAGGTGVSGANGTDGGPSFVGPDTNPAHAFVLAANGTGGMANTAGGQPPGGVGGMVKDSVGQTRIAGGNGTDGDSGGLTCSGAGGDGANGGSGGARLCGNVSEEMNRDGYPGNAPGGGGGGGRTSGADGGAHAGGAGAVGKVVITWVPSGLYYLTMAVAPPGSGTATDLTGTSPYAAGTVVNINAVAAADYWFVGWTAPAGSFANANAAATTFTMPAQNVTVTAHFELCFFNCYCLCINSTAGGNVTIPGEGCFEYLAGTEVNLVATPDADYGFLNWTHDVGAFVYNVSAASTTIFMNGDHSITANFEKLLGGYNLTISSTTGGNVTTPGEGTFTYDEGEVVNLMAEADEGYFFEKWTGGVTTIANVNAASTNITIPAQNVAITANFKDVLPSVTTQAATAVSTDSATLNMNYTVGNFSSVEVCFAYKKSADSAWNSTDWVSKSTDGTYAKPLTGLDSDTEYDFKAQLKYNSTVIEGTTRQFTTDAPSTPEPSGGYCFIATAAYGTTTAEQIDVLREFRDVVLLESTLGSQFVTLYYQLSPPVADFIARSDLLRSLVRELLVDPIVWTVEATGAIWRS
jgi:uncharacterized repeat protein (TIGR02543 family)